VIFQRVENEHRSDGAQTKERERVHTEILAVRQTLVESPIDGLSHPLNVHFWPVTDIMSAIWSLSEGKRT
jgi:hypothetical protein